jgi:4-amino-4-deoxy-L-arabinose transferase-like glycosyltransferase
LPSFLAGCGTIAALWWLGRSWFSPEVGLAAAALVALSDFHIAFSTTALTDVLLGLWIVLAVDAMVRAIAVGTLRLPSPNFGGPSFRDDGTPTRSAGAPVPAAFLWATIAGLYTGLAWWTKYNGWLPLAIEAAALPLLWLLLRPSARELRAWSICLAITACVAALIWSPFYYSLQSRGGYGPIAANHAKFVVGLAGWLHSAARLITNQFAIGIIGSFFGLALAIFVARIYAVPRGWLGLVWLAIKCLGGSVALLMLTGGFAVGVGAAMGLARMFLAFYRVQKLDAVWTQRAIGLILVGVWWAALLAATPLYTPYPRLVLPCLLAACLGCALNLIPELEPKDGIQKGSRLVGCLVIGFMFCMGGLLAGLAPHRDHFERLMDRRGLLQVARQVRATDIRAGHRVIYVFGEPALFFQLRATGEELVSPIAELPSTAAVLDGQPITTFVIAGPHAHQDPEFARQLAAAAGRWELANEFDYRPSAIVWLDLHDPSQSPQSTAQGDRVRLYRLRQ